MKHLIPILILILISAFYTQVLMAQDSSSSYMINTTNGDTTYLDSGDEKERTHAFSIWIPGIFTKGISWFVNKEEEPEMKRFLKNAGSMTIRVVEGNHTSKRFQRKRARWTRKIERKNLDDLIVVQSADANVRIKAGKVVNSKIRKYAISVLSDDALVYITGNGKFDLNTIIKMLEDSDSI